MTSLMPSIESVTRAPWLLPVSLALNLFLVGAAGAVAIRSSGTVPLSNVARIDANAMDRVSRMASSLPINDAQVMRQQLRHDAVKVAAAQTDLRLAQEQVRATLRAQPFDLDAMRAAMTQVQATREKYHTILQDMFAVAAVKMSEVGRNKLADWTGARSAGAMTPN
jgi:uncharacterized membrane protein